MEKLPGPLIYQLLKFLPLHSVGLLETFSSTLQNKLKNSFSGLRYIVQKQLGLQASDYHHAKYVIRENMVQRQLYAIITSELCVYNPADKSCNTFQSSYFNVNQIPLPGSGMTDTLFQFRYNMAILPYSWDLIVLGGIDSKNEITNEVWKLNIRDSSWVQMPPMKEVRQCPGAVKYGKGFYVFGGFTDRSSTRAPLNSAEGYDKSWMDLGFIPMGVAYPVISLKSHTAYITGMHAKSIITYNFQQKVYEIIQSTIQQTIAKDVLISIENENLYQFSSQKSYEMNLRGEILRCVENPAVVEGWFVWYTGGLVNLNGCIYAFTQNANKVRIFFPKSLTMEEITGISPNI